MTYSFSMLNGSKPAYSVCCGYLHATKILLAITVYLIFIQVINGIAFVLSDEYSTWAEIVFEVFVSIVTSSLLVAYIKEISMFLIPYIIQMSVFVLLSCIITIRVALCVVFPYSASAEDLIPDKSATTFERIKLFWIALAILTTITTFLGWCLHVGITCYKYFNASKAEKLLEDSKPTVSFTDLHPLVVVDPMNAKEQYFVSKDSFPSPNFSITYEDDDEGRSELLK